MSLTPSISGQPRPSTSADCGRRHSEPNGGGHRIDREDSERKRPGQNQRKVVIGMAGPAAHGRRKALVSRSSTALEPTRVPGEALAAGPLGRRSRLAAAARCGELVFGPVANDIRRAGMQNWSDAAECFVSRPVLAGASGPGLQDVGLARAADCLRHRSRSVSLGWFRAA